MEFDYSLLAKYLTGNISAEELSAIQAWAKSAERNASLWKEIIALRMKDNFDRFNTPEQIDKALSAIQERVGRKRFRLSFRMVWRYAAMFILALGCALGYFVYESRQVEEYTLIVAAGNPVKKITLRDSSVVWLRSGTRMYVPENFSAQNRSLGIEGEAFFSVKRDSLSPFVVKAGDIYVKVLGTSFNLKTNEDANSVETTLVSGHVVLMDEEEKEILDMHPGEKVLFESESKTWQIQQVDVNTQGVWHLGQSVLENMTLGEIAERIAGIYQVHFNFATKQLADKKYRFVFNKGESIEEICSNLEYIAPIHCKIEGKEIFITYKE